MSKEINVCFLSGNFDQRQNIISQIKNKLGKFDTYLCDNKTSYQYIKQQIAEGSCFGDKKLIILNDIPSTEKSRTSLLNDLKKTLLAVPDGCVVILNNLKISSKIFISHIEKIGKVFNFDKNKIKQVAKGEVLKYFSDREKEISGDDAYLLVDSLNFNGKEVDIDRLNLLLKKIEQYSGKDKKISNKDVVDICSQSGDFIIWSLFNSLDDKDMVKSLLLMERSFSVQDVNKQAIVIIYSLLRRYKLLLMAKDNLTRQKTKEETWQEISKLIKLEKKGVGLKSTMNPKEEESLLYSKRAFDALFNSFYGRKPTISQYKLKELIFIDSVLRKSLTKIRFNCSESEIILILNLVCMAICGFLNKNSNLDILDTEVKWKTVLT